MDVIDHAILFAAAAHAGQRRRWSGVPYLVHPLGTLGELYQVAAEPWQREALGPAAVLHDVIEDTEVTAVQIAGKIGGVTAGLVSRLTWGGADTGVRETKLEYLGRICRDAAREVVLLKLCDRADNIRDLGAVPDKDWVSKYSAETVWLCAAARQRLIADDPKDWLGIAIAQKIQQIERSLSVVGGFKAL